MSEEVSTTGKRYDREDVIDGLTAVAFANGNCRKASRELKKLGKPISSATLVRWKKIEVEDYERIRRELLPVVGARLAEAHADLAEEQITQAAALGRELFAERDSLAGKDKVNLLGKLDIGAGIHTQRASELQGDFSTPPKPTRTVEEILRSLQARAQIFEEKEGGALELPAVAVEDVDAESDVLPASGA